MHHNQKLKIMTRLINKGFINSRIIEKLDKIGYDQFYENQQCNRKSYDVDFIFNYCGNKYLFKVCFEIDLNKIKPDTEYFGINVSTGKEFEFKAINRSNISKSLQELFDQWYEKYCDYLMDEKDRLMAIEETKYILNEKNR